MTTTTERRTDLKQAAATMSLTPAYVAVGLTDLALEKMRAAHLFDPIELRKEFTAQTEKSVKQVQQAPSMLMKRGRKLAERAQAQHDVLAERGEQVIDRIRNQQASKDLKAQLDNTVSVTKGAMSTARNAVQETERAAVATLQTGIDEAEQVAVKFAETAREDTTVTAASIREATARTRAAARRTRAVAQQGAKNTSSRAKATTTSARKSASKATAAANAAAAKLDD